ncbi:uncharacterized protein LOC144784213 [Lissotriton helveticus]
MLKLLCSFLVAHTCPGSNLWPIPFLWTVYTWSLRSTLAQEQLFAPTGSSVLLSAPTKDKLEYIQWTFLKGGEAKPIVDYFSDKKDLLIRPRYAAKVEFFTSNGSLLLKNVQAADSGVYKVGVNLREDEARLIELIIVGPLPRPEIKGNSSLAGSPAEIICEVPVGDVDSIEWKKDGGPLPPDACYQSKNHSVLYISKLDLSHCTYYTCNISNRFYWNESSYNLTFEACRVILDSAAPGGVLLAMLFSSLLIENINKLKGEGCSDAEDHSVLTIVLCLVLLAVTGFCARSFMWYHRRRGGPEEGGGGGAGSEVEEHWSDEGEHQSDEGGHRSDEGEHQSDEGEHRSDEGEHRSDEGELRSDEGEHRTNPHLSDV